MPTPRQSIVPRIGPIVPIWAKRSMITISDVATPSENSAVPMGRSIATPDPSEMSRMITAKARPMSSACSEIADCGALRRLTTGPPKWTSTPADDAGWAACSNWSRMSLSTSPAGTLNCTEVYRMVPCRTGAGGGGELLPEQVDGALRVGARDGEVVDRVSASPVGHCSEGDGQEHPGCEEPPVVTGGEAPKSPEHGLSSQSRNPPALRDVTRAPRGSRGRKRPARAPSAAIRVPWGSPRGRRLPPPT
jgi:hypothetical protein